MILAFVLVVLVVGSVIFHLMSPWWFTPIASNWDYIDHTIVITFWITGVVFVAVGLFMAYCVFRFRHQEGTRAAYEPENKRLEWWLTVLTTLGVAGLLTPGLFVWNQYVTVPAGADTIEVMAQPLVLRLVCGPCSLLVAKAEHAIGHEQTDSDENNASDPECDGDRVIDVIPIGGNRRPPPRAHKVKYHRANDQNNQYECQNHIVMAPI